MALGPVKRRLLLASGGVAVGGLAALAAIARSGHGTAGTEAGSPPLREPVTVTVALPHGGPYGLYASAARWALGHAARAAERRAPARLRVALAEFEHRRRSDGTLYSQAELAAAAAAAGQAPSVVALASWP